MIPQADTNYSINPWMNPKARVGDDVDPSRALDPVGLITEVENLVPFPPEAVPFPRFLGVARTQPDIIDVLNIGPTGGILMRDTPTRQDSGQPGTLTPSQGHW